MRIGDGQRPLDGADYDAALRWHLFLLGWRLLARAICRDHIGHDWIVNRTFATEHCAHCGARGETR